MISNQQVVKYLAPANGGSEGLGNCI